MYHTPIGDRVLVGTERQIIADSAYCLLCHLKDVGRIEFLSECDTFTSLTRNSQIFAISFVISSLIDPEVEMPKLNAWTESTVCALIMGIGDVLAEEEDSEQANSVFRISHLLQKFCADINEEHLTPEQIAEGNEWEEDWLDKFTDGLLWDMDFQGSPLQDLQPEVRKEMGQMFGYSEGYFTDIPDNPSDVFAAVMLEQAMGFLRPFVSASLLA